MTRLPNRLHHTAYVSGDLEATRRFYEEIIGLPLIATYCEKDELFGKERIYCHVFFGMADGSALAFFQFADADDQAEFGPKMPDTPFHHIALDVDAETQAGIEVRIAQVGLKGSYVLEHGYCRSVYVRDPNGMIVEFTVDAPGAVAADAERRAAAHDELRRWLAGDHSNNNIYRGDHASA
jgi:catechol 2,3-dioxygenase-like lactoylglutathione lyase family enzyme